MGDGVRSARSTSGRDAFRGLKTPLLLVLPLALLTVAAKDSPPVSNDSDPELKTILDRAAEYCDRLDHAVMNFVCRERIEEWFRPGAGLRFHRMQQRVFLGERVDHDYLYDYQLVRDRRGEIAETRTLLKEDGKKAQVPDAPLKTRTFWHTKIVMGPSGILGRQAQADHDYKIVARERLRGEEVLVVEAEPRPGARLQHLFGTIWIRAKDAGILKIEWNPSSIDNYQKVEETAKFLGLDPYLLIMSEYGVEQNGIRFPSRYRLKEIYRRGKSGAAYQISQIDVFYDGYRFFTVETEVKY
jgi:hypothetical protein